MDIRQLETFVWIARLGSVTEACKRLNVTQSTLSMRLRGLERDLRVTLFDRTHKRLELTTKGRALIPHAEKIVAGMHQVRLAIADPTAEFGTLRVGMSEFVALSWGPQLVHRITDKYPNVTLDLEVGVPAELLEHMVSGQLDVLLAPVLVRPAPPINISSLGVVRFSWMASASLQLPKGTLTPLELKEFPIVSYDGRRSLFFPAIQRRWFAEYGVEVGRLYVCNSLATSISLITEGIAIGVLPLDYCRPLIKAGKLQIIDTAQVFEHEYLAMWHEHSEKSLASVVADMAHDAFAECSIPADAKTGRRSTKR